MELLSKLHRHYLLFVDHVMKIKRSIFAFLFCLPPTSFLASILLLFLVYNGFFVFSIQLPFPAQSETLSGTKSIKKSPASLIYAVKEYSTPHLIVNNRTVSVTPAFKVSRSTKIRRLKSVSKFVSSREFSTRVKEFYRNSGCKARFFMVWIASLDIFGDRELFSMESLFMSHRNACLVIISNSMDSDKGNVILKPFKDKGFKVIAVKPDFDYLFKNTDADSWFQELKKGRFDPGKVSLGQNLSNLLRLALLYKYGGIYIDTDVVVLKKISRFRNVIGAQTVDVKTGNWSRLNNAVLIFDKKHPILLKFIQEFALTFDGNKWGHNGPYLVSRVVSRVNGRPEFKNVTVVPPSAFYPVNWSRIQSLFIGPRNENHSIWLRKKLEQIKRESFAVHLWNKQSRYIKIEDGSIIKHLITGCCAFCNSSSSIS